MRMENESSALKSVLSDIKKKYSQARLAVKEASSVKNIMEVPNIVKITLNIGVGDAVSNSKSIANAMSILEAVTGQKAVKTYARKSIAGFKIREGMAIGVMTTLRGASMHIFLDKLINLALPKVRDFQGTTLKLDGRGNYNLGIKEWMIFPEAEDAGGNNFAASGMNITIVTSGESDDLARELLRALGMPFRRTKVEKK